MADQNFTVDTGLTVTGTGGNITGANNITAANSISVSGNAGDITMTGGNITGFTALVGNTANITMTAGEASWILDTTARLQIPNNGVITTPDATGGDGGYHVDILGGASDPTTYNTNPGGNVNIQGGYGSYNDGSGAIGGDVNLFGGVSPENTSGNVNVYTGSTSQNQWTFDSNGLLTVPDGIDAQVGNDLGLRVYNPNSEGGVTFLVQNYDVELDNRTTQFEVQPANIVLSTDFGNNRYQWNFDSAGNLTLPTNTSSINYANGQPYGGSGGGGSYGNSDVATFLATFGSNSIQTTGNINGGNINGGGDLDIDGNAHIGGNLFVVGNINFSGNVTQISGNSGSFFGNAAGVGALYAGIPVGYSNVVTAVIQATSDLNDYTQINAQNLNHGNTASMEYVITGDYGTDTADYLDFGFSSSGWDGTQTNSLGNVVKARDGYLYVQGGGGGGNLVIGTTTASRTIKFNVGGPNTNNTVGEIFATGLSMVGNVSSGNVNVSGNVNALSAFVNAAAVLASGRIEAGTSLSAVGNITGGNILTAGLVSANSITLRNSDNFNQVLFSSDGGATNNGYVKVDGGTNMVIGSAADFSVKRAGSDRISVTSTTADFMASTNVRIQSNKAVSAYTWTFDNTGNLAAPGNASITGNVTGGNLIGTLASGNSNIAIGASSSMVMTVSGAAAMTVGSTGVQIQGTGRLLSPGGAASITLNNNGANIPTLGVTAATNATSTTTGAAIISGGVGVAGNIYLGGIVSATGDIITSANLSAVGATVLTANATLADSIGTNKTSGTITIGGASQSGAITMGQSVATNTVNIQTGNPNGANTKTLNLGTGALVSSTITNINIGTQWGVSNTTVYGNFIIANTFTTLGSASISAAGNVTGGNVIATTAVSAASVTATNITANGGNFVGNTNGYAIGYLNIPQVAASNTTIILTDAGKHYYSTSGANLTITIPNNLTTSFPIGTAISFVVQSAGNILVNAVSGVSLYIAGSSTTGNRVIGSYGMATLMKVASDTWFINGAGVS